MRPVSIYWATTVLVLQASPLAAEPYSNAHRQISEQLKVDHAQIVLSASGAPATGYLAVWNGTRQGAYLVAVQSEAFGSTFFQRTEYANNIARTRPVRGGLFVPGHSELLMKPGGINMILSDPKTILTVGKNVPLTLTFDDGTKVKTTAEVLAPEARPVDHHHGEGDKVDPA